MSHRNTEKHAGRYLARVHSPHSCPSRHEEIEIELSPWDIFEALEETGAVRGRTPRSAKGFMDWWNMYSPQTTCSCGAVPKLELLRKL